MADQVITGDDSQKMRVTKILPWLMPAALLIILLFYWINPSQKSPQQPYGGTSSNPVQIDSAFHAAVVEQLRKSYPQVTFEEGETRKPIPYAQGKCVIRDGKWVCVAGVWSQWVVLTYRISQYGSWLIRLQPHHAILLHCSDGRNFHVTHEEYTDIDPPPQSFTIVGDGENGVASVEILNNVVPQHNITTHQKKKVDDKIDFNSSVVN